MIKVNNIFVLMCIAVLTICSCRNTKEVHHFTPTDADIEAQKGAIADSVLTIIDEYALKLKDKGANPIKVFLSETERMVKPDYLLSLDKMGNAFTSHQKINLLGMISVDYVVRSIYNLPVDDLIAESGKLMMELNHPIDVDTEDIMEKISPGQGIQLLYDACKSEDQVDYFWQLENAIVTSMEYVISQDPELYFSKISQEDWSGFMNRVEFTRRAVKELNKYDNEFESLKTVIADEEFEQLKSLDYAKANYKTHTSEFVENYNNLLR